jgi:hypothetical protein
MHADTVAGCVAVQRPFLPSVRLPHEDCEFRIDEINPVVERIQALFWSWQAVRSRLKVAPFGLRAIIVT